jgi:hypothetical protein
MEERKVLNVLSNELHPLKFWDDVDSASADLRDISKVCQKGTFLCGINGSGKVFVPIYSSTSTSLGENEQCQTGRIQAILSDSRLKDALQHPPWIV